MLTTIAVHWKLDPMPIEEEEQLRLVDAAAAAEAGVIEIKRGKDARTRAKTRNVLSLGRIMGNLPIRVFRTFSTAV